MKTLVDPNTVRDAVRETYGKIALGAQNGCCGDSACGCHAGYTPDEIAALPEGAYLGLSCGNPQAIAALKPGETVLDLGSGAGFDCLLAARSVGPAGRVIGVDMTPEMLAKARANAARAGITNAEFRLGEIEALPLADNSVDAIISNCVINLSPDKSRVFHEAFRTLKPGGRLAIADILRTGEFPPDLANDLGAHCACVAGAATVEETKALLREAGFVSIAIRPKTDQPPTQGSNDTADPVISVEIEAVKPGAACCASDCCG